MIDTREKFPDVYPYDHSARMKVRKRGQVKALPLPKTAAGTTDLA